MADAYQTLADLLVINDQNLADLNVTDLLDDAPLIKLLAAEPASNGTLHKYTKETGAPVVGFRDINAGLENTKSADTLVTVTLKLLDASFTVDKGLALAYHKGVEAYVERELKRFIKAAYANSEKQMINGTGNNVDGFTGLADALPLANNMTYNATGAAADTASSAYFIRTNADGNDCTVITGKDGQIEVGETTEGPVAAAGGGTFTGLSTSVLAWLGLQIGSAYSVGRICNITAEAGKMLTDAMIGSALQLFPTSKQPTYLAMNRRSQWQLQASRTATSPTGAEAPLPTSTHGIDIIPTDSILSTEAILV